MSSTTMHDGRVVLHQGDSRDVLRGLADNSIDSIVCDPPYALVSIQKRFAKSGRTDSTASKSDAHQRFARGFMGKTWDNEDTAFAETFWAECLRVLKPGGHVVAFGGTRTYHRLVCAIEDAGFEIRDQLGWVYGCLDDQTQAVTPHGVMPYHKIKQGDLVLAYDPTHMSYQWEQVEEVCVYDVDDTVYRIATDFGDQVVSRNHRCIVERDGAETFEFAENAARQREIRVPVLENLRALLDAIPDAHQGASRSQQDVLTGLHESGPISETVCYGEACGPAHSENSSDMHGLRDNVLAEREAPVESRNASVQLRVQRGAARPGVEGVCAHGQGEVEAGIRSGTGGAHDGRDEPSMEGRGNVSESTRELCVGSVRQVPTGVPADVAQGRLHHGASPERGEGNGPTVKTGGMCASHRPQSAEQRTDEPDAIRDEQRPQAVRAWAGHKAVVGRITPERYRGVIWCVRVKSGAFVAVRNGFAFPTGNSGFPKSHNQSGDWQGWGSALKPAWEPICLARKPLTGTIAANLAEWGVGALNIDGCRVDGGVRPLIESKSEDSLNAFGNGLNGSRHAGETTLGRWPANIIHDGSDEVLAAFPDAKGQQGDLNGQSKDRKSKGIYGDMPAARQALARIETDTSAARFFYCAKASRKDRDEGLGGFEKKRTGGMSATADGSMLTGSGNERTTTRANIHPTVKPTSLMQWLCRLITPPGGTILDPFMGSGSTGKAAVLEGFNFVGIEREDEYMPIAEARIAWAVLRVTGGIVDAPAPANDNTPVNDNDLFAERRVA